MAIRSGTPTAKDHEDRKFTRQSQLKMTGHAVPRIVNTFDGSNNLTRSDEYQGNREITNIQMVADSSGSLNNTYWFFYSAADATTYYVWYNVASGGVDPAPGGTGIEVAIATNATAEDVNDATIAQINTDASADVKAKKIGTSRLELANQTYGTCTAVVDSNSGIVPTQIAEGSDWTLVASTLITYDGSNNPTEIIRLEH